MSLEMTAQNVEFEEQTSLAVESEASLGALTARTSLWNGWQGHEEHGMRREEPHFDTAPRSHGFSNA